MFKSAASKLAHSTTVPALAGSKDRALQNLITAEKSVLQSIQKLAVDLTKASEALKVWGNGEGIDLGDVLTASTMLMLMFSEALNVYANYEGTIRGHMKSIRTREENLEELKQRRKALGSRADSADKKLAKMNPEHKQLQAQKELLTRLQDDMRNMDADIMNQEANLLDFKRYFTKTFMGLKFGGLQELCDKGLILAEHGKLVITEIPMEPTQPGFPRAPYTGNPRTERLVGEAQRLSQSVIFSETPSQSVAASARPTSFAGPPSSPQSAVFQQHSASGSPAPQAAQPIHGQPETEFRKFSLGPEFNADSLSLPYMQSYPAQQGGTPGIPQPQQYPGYAPQGPPMPSQTIPDEFGNYNAQGQFPARSNSLGPSGPNYLGNPSGGGPQGPRFATVGARPMYPGYLPEMGDRPLSLDVAPSQASFSSSVAQALGTDFSNQGGPSSPTHPSGTVSITYSKAKEVESEKEKDEKRMSVSPPPPVYSMMGDEKHGKAPDTLGDGQFTRDEEPALAYMASEPQGFGSGFSSRHDERRVQFGGDQGSEGSHEPVRNAPQNTQPAGGYTSSPADLSQSRELPTTDLQQGSPRHPALSSYRVPPPREEEEHEDEHALNAAAAREVSRELDSLMFQSTLGPRSSIPPSQAPQPETNPSTQPQSQPRATTPTQSQPPTSSYFSPTREEPQYVRERYRSPTLQSSHSREGGAAGADDYNQSASINLGQSRPGNSPSPALSYRTPDEYPGSSPAPAPPRPFYTLGPASGSASSLTGGDGPRKISAAAFKRARPQGPNSSSNLNSPIVPPDGNGGGYGFGGGPGQGQGPGGDGRVSPLVIQKRSSRNLEPGQGLFGPRHSPEPGDGNEYRGRNVSGQQLQQQQQQQPLSNPHDSGAYDDTYDYISAYSQNAPGH